MMLLTHDLTDPAFWARDDAYELLTDMRRQGAVQPQLTRDEGPMWAVLAHREATTVLSDAETFSSEGGSLLGTGPASKPAGVGRMMALSDPPRHRAYREPVMPFFSNKRAERMRPRVRDLTERVVERAAEKGTVDFVQDIGTIAPLTIMCDLMGVPDEDRDAVVEMCDAAFLGNSSEARADAHQRLLPYLFDLAVERRARPRDDVISALATWQTEDGPLELDEVVLNCDNIIVGGIQTVRHTSAMAMLALMRDAAAWRHLQSGQATMQTAVEELLRWTSVGLHVLRTARQDTELGGQQITAGDRVVVWTPSCNRDPAVFENPETLDLERKPNRHIAFGWGPHYCIGAPLARVELQALFEILSTRLELAEEVDPPTYNQSIINFGLDAFPVALHRRAAAEAPSAS